MGGSFIYLQRTTQGRSAARERVCPRWDYEALVRVAGQGHRAGKVGQGRDMEFQKQKLRLGRVETWSSENGN